MRIAVVSAGGTGGYFGGLLARAGQDVTFIARGAYLEALRAGPHGGVKACRNFRGTRAGHGRAERGSSRRPVGKSAAKRLGSCFKSPFG